MKKGGLFRLIFLEVQYWRLSSTIALVSDEGGVGQDPESRETGNKLIHVIVASYGKQNRWNCGAFIIVIQFNLIIFKGTHFQTHSWIKYLHLIH